MRVGTIALFCLIACGGTSAGTNLPPPVVDSFTVSPIPVHDGGFATLTWSVTGADSVTANGIPVASQGSLTRGPLHVPAMHSDLNGVFTLTAVNAGGQTTRDVAYTVTDFFAPIMPLLTEKHQVITIDLQGHI
jgi:hypothetical protein